MDIHDITKLVNKTYVERRAYSTIISPEIWDKYRDKLQMKESARRAELKKGAVR